MAIGPVQILVLGFDEPEFTGKIREEFARLRDSDVVRLVDAVVVRKDADGNVERQQISDLTTEEAEEFGATVGALIGLGFGDEEHVEAAAVLGAMAGEDGHVLPDTWYVDDAIPNDSAAVIALVEHRWAIPLREAILSANGTLLADAWIHPTDLVAIGLLASEEAAAH
jgi:uncharacterized membrane protein